MFEENGLDIYIKYPDGDVKIAGVYYDEKAETCYVRTEDTKLQDCITSWELFVEFVMLLDDAYDRICMAVRSSKLDKFLD